MGSNVFGTPISTEMLKAMPEYHDKKSISQKDKAIVALQMKNAEGKDINAQKFVENLQSRFGGGNLSTMCLIYNATGETVTFAESYDWKGRVTESPYPTIIANGQWGAFLQGEFGSKASRGGVVYSGINNTGDKKHWFMGFGNLESRTYNSVYTELGDPGHFVPENTETWYALDQLLDRGKSVHHTNDHGGLMFASIGNFSISVFEAIMTLPEAIREDQKTLSKA